MDSAERLLQPNVSRSTIGAECLRRGLLHFSGAFRGAALTGSQVPHMARIVRRDNRRFLGHISLEGR
jgi:hypothetical protein